MNDSVTEAAPAPESETGTETWTETGTEGENEGENEGATGPELVAEPGYDPATPAPLHVVRTPTGNADVDARLERLGDADHLATDGHVKVYEDVHEGLRDALTALDARPGPPGPTRHPTTAPR